MKLEDGCRLDSIQSKNYDGFREDVEILFDSAGRMICEFSKRKSSNSSKYTREISKATKDFLVEALFDEHQDENFVLDFLLTKNLIHIDSHYLLETLVERCDLNRRLIDRVFPIIFLWANKFFVDFQYNAAMKYSLLKFVELLESEEMRFRASRLEQTCSDKSLCRCVKIDRDNLNSSVIFFSHKSNLRNFDIFVEDLLPSFLLRNDESFLMPGDQVLSLNGVDICSLRSEEEFLSKLKTPKRSTIIVKWNLSNFKKAFYGERKNTLEFMKHSKSLKHNALSDLSKNNFLRFSSSQKDLAGTIGKFFKKITNSHREFHLSQQSEWRRKSMGIKKSRSNPDLEIHTVEQSTDDRINDMIEPDFIIRVFRSDQSFKYFSVFKETTAQNVVQLALQEFGLAAGQEPSFNWALYEVSSRENGTTAQKRLSNLQNELSDRLDLNSRYYLKNLHSQEQLLPDHYKQILHKASRINFLNLNDEILASQLCLRDFELFAAIHPSDYICELTSDTNDETKMASARSREKLNNFERIFNTESLWVAYEILREKNESKRFKIMKKFVKIADLCFELQNYNSTFAIVCGLEKPCVKRLQSIWDRMPMKYTHILHDLHTKILDPSRNMAHYRGLLEKAAKSPPVLPIFPIILKDLFFLNQYNKTYVDDIGEKMVNFSKLKMISENLQFVSRLTSKCYADGSQAHNYLKNATLSYSTSYANRMFEYFPISNVMIDRQSLSARKSRYDLTLRNLNPIPLEKHSDIQMKKKCRTYLQNLGVLGDDVLDQFEPKEIGSPKRNVLIDRSPCPSDSSSIKSETSSGSRRSKLVCSEPPSPANQTKIQRSPRLIMLSSSDDRSVGNSSSPSIVSGGDSSVVRKKRQVVNGSEFSWSFGRPKPLVLELQEGDLDLFDQATRV